MDNIHLQRIEALRSLMRLREWDAVVITAGDPHASEYPAPRWKQVEWLSGFTGEAGDMVVTAGHAGLWTDTRFFIQALHQLEGTGVELHKMRVPEAVPIPEWLSAMDFDTPDGTVTIAVDGNCITSRMVEDITIALDGRAVIVNIPDLLSGIWTDRPEVPSTPIITLGEDACGESREHKIQWLRKFLMQKDVDAILLTALDEIAYILNVRGSDIEYNPLVISYLLVGMDAVEWFVKKDPFIRPDRETEASFREIKADGIGIKAYDDLPLTLSGLAPEDGISSLYVDPSTLSYALELSLDDISPRVRTVTGPSPVPLRKAVKNNVERDGLREAHLEDGKVMELFLYELENLLEAGEDIDEAGAALILGRLRRKVPGYRCDSFATISAYGANAALPHYVTPGTGSARLLRKGLYLVDSGGQYLFGTTDITRTVPLGPCTPLEREDYTLVLKGHIDLAMAVFPEGTPGCRLDCLARNPLWSNKRNYGHGTGHGVGFFLNVHEGPQDLRQDLNGTALRDGMTVSDEPGIYREGRHGVRHENILLCRSAGENDFGRWMEFETMTLCHFDTSAIIPELLDRAEIKWLNAYNERVFRTLSPLLPQEVSMWLRRKTLPIG